MRKRELVELDPDTKIDIQQLAAYPALRLLHRLTKAVGPAVAKAGAGAKNITLAEVDLGNLAEAAEIFFEHFSEQDLEEVTKLLLAECVIHADGKQGPPAAMFPVAFDGHPDLLLKAVLEALKLNYGTFFDAARGFMAARVATQVPPSTSPQTSPKSGPANV